MKRSVRRATARRSRGFALIVVLWFLVLIAAISTYLLVAARTETAIARNIGLAAGAEALADAGIAQAAFNLTDDVKSNHWKMDGRPHRLLLSGGEVVIRLSDENAKVNPNHASDALLAALFESAGVERMRARRLGAVVADWVGAETVPRRLGAKLEQYRQAGLSYGPPNAPIESLDDLQLVLGMTPEIFAAVLPYLTIYTQGEPASENVSPVVQRALMLAAREPPEPAAAQDAAPAAAPAFDPDAPAAAAAPPVAAAVSMPAGEEKAAMPTVRVKIVARLVAGGVFVRDAVLRLDPDNAKGYAVLDWRRGILASND